MGSLFADTFPYLPSNHRRIPDGWLAIYWTARSFIPGRRAAIEESDLIRLILSGDRDLYAELVDRNGTYLFQLCLALLGDSHQAEEAAQVVFIKAYQSLASFRGNASFRTWLTRIGLNHCKDLLRQRKRRRFLSLETLMEEGRTVPEAPVEESEEAPKLPQVTEAMLETLTEGEKNLIRLVGEGNNMSYEEMGKRLGLSLDGVKGRLKRARMKLRRFLKGSASQDDEGRRI